MGNVDPAENKPRGEGRITKRQRLTHWLRGPKKRRPPNLRPADEGSIRRCRNCTMFVANDNTCSGYGNYPVKPKEVCDSFERKMDD